MIRPLSSSNSRLTTRIASPSGSKPDSDSVIVARSKLSQSGSGRPPTRLADQMPSAMSSKAMSLS